MPGRRIPSSPAVHFANEEPRPFVAPLDLVVELSYFRCMTMTRRTFLAAAATPLVPAAEPIIDIHQHTTYSGRSDDDLVAHQQTMGVTKTVLLPAGSKYGLAAGAGGN